MIPPNMTVNISCIHVEHHIILLTILSEGRLVRGRKWMKRIGEKGLFSHLLSVRCRNRCLYLNTLCVYYPYLRRSKCLRFLKYYSIIHFQKCCAAK